jgi:PKHD-type hydroxylase
MFYGQHLDAPLMRGSHTMRADVSVTVFLSEPADYVGGELVISADQAPVAVKAAAGDAVLYAAGALHEVRPVESGARLVAVTWLQSMVRDAEQRRLLFSLGASIAELEKQGSSTDTLLRLRATHDALLRMWLEA